MIHAPKTAAALAAALMLAFTTGCATSRVALPVDEPVLAAPQVAGVATLLLADEDEEDDEFVGLLTEPKEDEPVAPVETGPGTSVGVRLGSVSPLSTTSGTWNSGIRLGVFLRAGSSKRVEIGVDYASLEGDYGGGASVKSTIASVRADILFGSWSSLDKSTTLYFLGGGEFASENATWDATSDTLSATGGGLNVGLGLGSTEDSWDFRTVYTIAGGDNVGGIVSVSVGIGF